MKDGAFEAGLAGMAWGRTQGLRQGQMDGFADGEEQGYTAGFQDGRTRGLNEGRSQGKEEGRVDGWNQATAQANEVIVAYHDERDRLYAAVQEQRVLIEALEQRVRTLEAGEAQSANEAGELREANAAMVETVAALKTANERLVADMESTQRKLDITEHERDVLQAQHNQALVFITTVRGVLNELVFADSAEAERARILFADKYHKRVATALAEGRINCPLDESPEFMEAFPSTHEFLRRLLDAVELDAAQSTSDADVFTL